MRYKYIYVYVHYCFLKIELDAARIASACLLVAVMSTEKDLSEMILQADYQEINKLEPHNIVRISEVAVLVDQHIAKNSRIQAQFYRIKDSTKRIHVHNLEAFTSTETQMVCLQCLRFLAQLFRKLE